MFELLLAASSFLVYILKYLLHILRAIILSLLITVILGFFLIPLSEFIPLVIFMLLCSKLHNVIQTHIASEHTSLKNLCGALTGLCMLVGGYYVFNASVLILPTVLGIIGFTFSFTFVVLLYKLKSPSPTNLILSPTELNELKTKQQYAYDQLDQSLKQFTLTQDENKLFNHFNDHKKRLHQTEVQCGISLEPYAQAKKYILVFKEYELDEQWHVLPNHTQFYQESSFEQLLATPNNEGEIRPKHPINRDYIFEPDKHEYTSTEGKTISCKTRYRLHSYSFLQGGEEPVSLELCHLAENLNILLINNRKTSSNYFGFWNHQTSQHPESTVPSSKITPLR